MYYVLDEFNNKVEAFDKQGVLALLEQAIEDGDLQSIAADSAFVDKLKCCVGTGTHYIAFITQATYNELQANGQLITNAYYFITDDTTAQDLNEQLSQLTELTNSLGLTVTSLVTKTTRQIIKANGLPNRAEMGKTYTFIVKNSTFVLALPNDIPLSEMTYSETDDEYFYVIKSCISEDGYCVHCTIYKNANGELSYSSFVLYKNNMTTPSGIVYYYTTY